ncbi:MAG TPA: hypothetical protein VID50_07670 [Candidatus Eisenbacteria bacterium]|jgi:hypothetical protein
MSRTRQAKLATLDVVEEIARRVPGYRGYQEAPQRREDDRRFRSGVAEHLRLEARRLERIESRQFREDLSDLLEEVDGGAQRLEFLADSMVVLNGSGGGLAPADAAAESVGRLDHQIVEALDRLHRIVHELEKAFVHDQQFQMNLAELRSVCERVADLIEQRNIALTR